MIQFMRTAAGSAPALPSQAWIDKVIALGGTNLWAQRSGETLIDIIGGKTADLINVPLTIETIGTMHSIKYNGTNQNAVTQANLPAFGGTTFSIAFIMRATDFSGISSDLPFLQLGSGSSNQQWTARYETGRTPMVAGSSTAEFARSPLHIFDGNWHVVTYVQPGGGTNHGNSAMKVDDKLLKSWWVESSAGLDILAAPFLMCKDLSGNFAPFEIIGMALFQGVALTEPQRTELRDAWHIDLNQAIDESDLDPTTLSNLRLHLEGDSGKTDISPAAHTIAETGTVNVIAAGLNGHDYFEFDGTAYLNVSDGTPSVWKFMHDRQDPGCLVLMVVRNRSVAGDQVCYGTRSSVSSHVGHHLNFASGNDRLELVVRQDTVGNAFQRDSGDNALVDNTWKVVSIEWFGSDSANIKVDNQHLMDPTFVAALANSLNPQNRIAVGADGDGSLKMVGDIAEILVFEGRYNHLDVYRATKFLKTKYGV